MTAAVKRTLRVAAAIPSTIGVARADVLAVVESGTRRSRVSEHYAAGRFRAPRTGTETTTGVNEPAQFSVRYRIRTEVTSVVRPARPVEHASPGNAPRGDTSRR